MLTFAALEIVSSAGPVRRRLLPTTPPASVMFGRRDADVVFAERMVSRQHAVIELIGDRWRLQNLSPVSGTFVNGRRVDQATLDDGDVIELVRERVRFRRLEAPPAFLSADAERWRRRVLADPASDEERLVFADWLVERGDPVGELIQAQIAAAREDDDARRAGLAAHAEAIAGRVEAFIVGDPDAALLDWRVRRGFLDAILVSTQGLANDRLVPFGKRHPLASLSYVAWPSDDPPLAAARAAQLGVPLVPW